MRSRRRIRAGILAAAYLLVLLLPLRVEAARAGSGTCAWSPACAAAELAAAAGSALLPATDLRLAVDAGPSVRQGSGGSTVTSAVDPLFHTTSLRRATAATAANRAHECGRSARHDAACGLAAAPPRAPPRHPVR